MENSEFTSQRAGRPVEVEVEGEDFWIFEPERLPPEDLEYSQKTVKLIEEAASSLNRLSGRGKNLPNPNIFIQPYIIKEAVMSSQIEGTQTTFEEAVTEEEGDVETRRGRFDMEEVKNYVEALKFGIRQLEFKELSLQMIKKVHKRLLSGVRGKESSPGEFRDTYVHIGEIGVEKEDADFVPMSPEKVEDAMKDLLQFMKKDTDLPYLVKSALIHYQFETIHPFEDGNGRLGRLLVILDMVREGKLSRPLLYLSEYFNRNKTQYYDRLNRVRTRGEYEEWINFFLRAVKAQSRKASEKAAEVLEKMKDYKERLRQVNAPERCVRLMEKFFDFQPRTIKEVAEDTDIEVSYQTARSYLNILEEQEIVESRRKHKEKEFTPVELIELMQDETEHLRIEPPPR